MPGWPTPWPAPCKPWTQALRWWGWPAASCWPPRGATACGPWAEAFADRAYAPDGSLLPRGQPGAVLHDAEAVRAQVRELVLHQRVHSAAGWLPLQADTLCLHGDGPAALTLARALRAQWPRRPST